MKTILKIFLAALLAFTAVSCADGNALEWMVDKDTSEAKQDQLDFAFVKNNCSYVIAMLEPNETHLSQKQQYMYSNAILACSGFDIVKSMNVILSKNQGSGDPFVIIQAIMGTDLLDTTKIGELKQSYEKILATCTGNISTEMATICGMTAAADTVLIIGEIGLNLSGNDTISATKDGLTEIVDGKSEGEILGAVNNSTIDYDRLGQNLDTIINGSDAILDMAGESIDFADDLQEFTQTLKDPSTGSITNNSLSAYISSQFKKDEGGL